MSEQAAAEILREYVRTQRLAWRSADGRLEARLRELRERIRQIPLGRALALLRAEVAQDFLQR